MNAKRILVPIDFSPCSKSALRLAVDLANGRDATTVVVLHVVEESIPSFDEDLGVLEPEVLRTEAETLAASRSHDVLIDAVVQYGDPADTIIEYAEQQSIDLIVMGTHGNRGLWQVLLGGTAADVLRKASCPVLTVRDDSVTTLSDDDATSVTLSKQKV